MDFKFTTTKAEGTDKKEFLEKINQEKARNAEFKSKFKYLTFHPVIVLVGKVNVIFCAIIL